VDDDARPVAPSTWSAPAPVTGTISAVVTRADGSVEDLGVISVVELAPEAAAD